MKYFALLLLICTFSSAHAFDFSQVSPVEKKKIADLIYNNECNRQVKCLVAWNDGEGFPSLGIGHFIWFPQGLRAPFQESFPALLGWFESHDLALPLGLTSASPSLWQSKEEFLHAGSQYDIEVLRTFLANSKAQQIDFIMHRVQYALPKMLGALLSQQDRAHVTQQFEALTSSAMGWYVLADYVNFKGEGTNVSERYQGHGWGLMQVLLRMPKASWLEEPLTEKQLQKRVIQSFVIAAKDVLVQRIKHSPAERNEQRWLQGWRKRLYTYLND